MCYATDYDFYSDSVSHCTVFCFVFVMEHVKVESCDEDSFHTGSESDHNDNMEKMVFKTRSSWISHFKITPLRGIKEDFRNRIAYYRDDWTADGPIGTKTAKGGEIGDDSATEKETNDPRRPGLVPKHIQFLSSSFCFV